MFNYYILNLAHSEKRREHMRNALAHVLPPPIFFFTATCGAALSAEEKAAECANPELNDAEIGCAISHRNIYLDIIRTGKSCAFVFEDDIVPTAYVNSDVLQECREFILARERPSVLTLYKQRRPCAQVGTVGNDIPIYRCSRGSGTFAYVVNRAGAEALARVHTPILFEADMWMVFQGAGLVDVYATGEDLFTPADAVISASSINASGPRANDSKAHKKFKKQFLREHGYTRLDRLKAALLPRYYSLIRKCKR